MQKIIIIAGPSGAGKTTISDYLTRKYQIPRVITHTTRPKRNGEIDGKAYHFETPESFAKLHFFEHVLYGSFCYGSSRESLQSAWQQSDLVSLVVETDGVKSYLDAIPEAVYLIYLTVSDFKLLKERLLARGDDPKQIEKRLNSPEFKRDLHLRKELKPYAHVLVNDDWEQTKQALAQLIQHLKTTL